MSQRTATRDMPRQRPSAADVNRPPIESRLIMRGQIHPSRSGRQRPNKIRVRCCRLGTVATRPLNRAPSLGAFVPATRQGSAAQRMLAARGERARGRGSATWRARRRKRKLAQRHENAAAMASVSGIRTLSRAPTRCWNCQRCPLIALSGHSPGAYRYPLLTRSGHGGGTYSIPRRPGCSVSTAARVVGPGFSSPVSSGAQHTSRR
jgi:hypothetical protein